MWCSESLHGTAPYSITKDKTLSQKSIIQFKKKGNCLAYRNASYSVSIYHLMEKYKRFL